MYRIEIRGLIHAVACVYVQSRTLSCLAGDLRDYYVHGGEKPTDKTPLSDALRCEQNGAHRFLEGVLTEVKRLGRGHVPRRIIEYWLNESSSKLLDELRAIAKLLPSELKTLAKELRESVEDSRNTELELTHVILNDSGVDVDITHEAWKMRLNKLLRDLKRHFNTNAKCFDNIEVELEGLRGTAKPKKSGYKHRPIDEVQEIKRRDIAAIRKEVTRRHRAQIKRHRPTSLKDQLMRLCDDPAWSRRCRQWKRFETLYQYIVEK